MAEDYFKLLTASPIEIKSEQLSPRIRRLRGIIKTNKALSARQILREELSKKYDH